MKKKGTFSFIAVLMAAFLVIGMVPTSVLAKNDEETNEDGIETIEDEDVATTQDELAVASGEGFEDADIPVTDNEEPDSAGESDYIGSKMETDASETGDENDSGDEDDSSYDIMPLDAEASGTYGDLSWSIEDGVLTLSGSGAMIDVTDSYSERPWNDYCDSITSVVIEEGITSIGSSAFALLSNLTDVTLASTVESIGYGAFEKCTSLGSIDLVNVQVLGDYAFTGCTSLSSIDFGCVQTIGDYALEYTYSLKEVTFPNTLTTIGMAIFYGAGPTSLTIPDSVTEVSDYAFYLSENIEEVTFGSGLTSTSSRMFYACHSLKTINFGSALTEIAYQTFAYCDALETVVLPENITTIGNGCFGECTSLTTFESKGLTGTIPFQSFYECKSLTSVTFNEGVTKISRDVFYGCSSLAEITLPASVEFVYANSFPSKTVITNLNTQLSSYQGNGYRYIEDVEISGTYCYDLAYQVLDIVNEERAKEGLSPLVMDESLMESAMQRSSEISILFSHTRPDGSIWYYVNSSMRAENIGGLTSSPSVMMEEWMNSESHRANILGNYTTIGIGCFYIDGEYYWVQCFGNGNNDTSCEQPANKEVTNTVAMAVGEFDDPILSTGTYFGNVDSYTYSFNIILSDTLEVGETATAEIYVKGNVEDTNTVWTLVNNSSFTFESSDEAIAQVLADGTVIGISDGEVTITASLDFTSISKTIVVGNGASEEPGPGPESIDKTLLQEEYDTDKELNENDYTAESWGAFETALENAKTVIADDAATQEQVDATLEALIAAREALVESSAGVEPEPETVDKTALQEEYDEDKDLTESDYTEESWSAFKTALANAEAVLADDEATQDQVDAAEEALKTAKDALVKAGDKSEPGDVDKEALQKEYDEDKDLTDKGYTEESWNAFKTALANAEAVLNDDEATQEQVDAALEALKAAKEALVETEADNTREISGSKIWDDDDDKADARPDSITVNLYQNGGEKPYTSMTVTEDDGWSWSWTVPENDENGNAYVYTITEDDVKYYIPSYEKNGIFDITNTFVGEEGALTGSGTGSGGDNPKTGDTNNIALWLILMLAGAAGVFGVYRVRKRG